VAAADFREGTVVSRETDTKGDGMNADADKRRRKTPYRNEGIGVSILRSKRCKARIGTLKSNEDDGRCAGRKRMSR
jgi:hypothetical protein